jgi:hypothetical protein
MHYMWYSLIRKNLKAKYKISFGAVCVRLHGQRLHVGVRRYL